MRSILDDIAAYAMMLLLVWVAGCALDAKRTDRDQEDLSWNVSPKVGQTLFNVDVTEMGTINRVDRECAAFTARADLWTMTSHQRRMVSQEDGAQWLVSVRYTRSAEESSRLYAIGIGTDSQGPHGLSAKSATELRELPLWIGKGVQLTVGGVKQSGDLYVLSLMNVAPEDAMLSVFVPTSEVKRQPQGDRRCFHQVLEWTKEGEYSAEISGKAWKATLWRELPTQR